MWLRIGGEIKPDSAHSSSSLTVQIWLMCWKWFKFLCV